MADCTRSSTQYIYIGVQRLGYRVSGARLNDAQDSFLVPFCYTEKYVDHMMQVCISISGLYTVHTATWNLKFYIIHKGHHSKDFVGFRIVNQRRIP